MSNTKVMLFWWGTLQHNIQMDRIEDAIRDLENAISKCTTFAPSHVQKSFAGKDVLIFVLLFYEDVLMLT